MRTASLLGILLLLAAAACGGDDDGGGGGGGSDAEPWVPRHWSEGEQMGYAVLSHQTKTPTALMAEACALDVQFATALTEGGIEESDSEGSCIVTDTNPGWQSHEATLEPACAGIVTMSFGGTSRRLTLCADTFAPPIALGCDAVSSSIDLSVSSGPAEVDGDVVGSLAATVPRPEVPTITTPEPQGEGTAVWPEGEDLTVEWESGGAAGVEVVIGQVSGTGPKIRCLTADDGSFTVPGRLVTPYRSGTAFVEVAALTQATPTADGFQTRVTYRVSDAIWLFRR